MKRLFIVITLVLLVSVGCADEKISKDDNVQVHKEYHVFQGQSENWEGKIIADYTETFTEVDGKWRYDSEKNKGGEGYLRYKGSNGESIENVYYEVTDGISIRRGEVGLGLSNEIVLGTGIYRSDDIFTVTIKWNGLEETFQMKAIKSKITD